MNLPPGLDQAFLMAATELGMCSAARLFVRELAAAGGGALVAEARDQLGRAFPVLDFVAGRALAGEPELRGDKPSYATEPPDPAPVLRALAGIARLLVVGIEADFLDALEPRLDGVEVGLLAETGPTQADLRRALANYGGRVRAVTLDDFQRWAGRRSALLTFVYGSDGHVAHVQGAWLRVSGPDVRTQFRSLIGWDIFGHPLDVYPRWLVETHRDDFSDLVP